jgi:flavin-binding protein dodecin
VNRACRCQQRQDLLYCPYGIAKRMLPPMPRPWNEPTRDRKGSDMPESVYKIIELVGTSTESWEKAAQAAVQRASKTLRDIRIAEIADLDMHIKDGKVEAYRAKVKLSFKFED